MMMRRFIPTAALLLALAACTDSSLVESGAITDLGPAATVVPGVAFSAQDIAVALVDPGTVRVADGQILIRGLTVQYRWDGTDPRITGVGTLTANGNLDAMDGTGPVWGTIDEFVSDQGDYWVGNWRGHRRPNGSQWLADLPLLMIGRGANGEKLIARATNLVTTFTLQPSAYIGQVSGTIDSPGR